MERSYVTKHFNKQGCVETKVEYKCSDLLYLVVIHNALEMYADTMVTKTYVIDNNKETEIDFTERFPL